jgi:hypothetical protein
MTLILIWLKALRHCSQTINRVLIDLVELLRLATKSRSALVAGNLFLRKQLAMFRERNARYPDPVAGFPALTSTR